MRPAAIAGLVAAVAVLALWIFAGEWLAGLAAGARDRMSGQLLVNGLVNAALIAPPAIALSLIFSVLRFPNFAIGGYITVGAFAAYLVNWDLSLPVEIAQLFYDNVDPEDPPGLPVWASAIFAMVVTALVVWFTAALIFMPMRDQGPVTLLVVSIALTLILENIVRLIWGSGVRGFDFPTERGERTFYSWEEMRFFITAGLGALVALLVLAAARVRVLLWPVALAGVVGIAWLLTTPDYSGTWIMQGRVPRAIRLELFDRITITQEQIELCILAVVIAVGMHLLLQFTRIGKAMRATADNAMLAEARGIDTRLVIIVTWIICGALFGLTGVLAGLDLVIEPLIGWNLTIPIFAAAILGGIGSPYGAMLGALFVGIAEELTVLILPSTYKLAMGFFIIAILLLLRPHGLLGQPEIKK